MLNGSTVASRAFNSSVVDGAVGVFARGGAASFDSFGLKTDDLAWAAAAAGTGGTSSTSSASAPSTFTIASASAPIGTAGTGSVIPGAMSVESTSTSGFGSLGFNTLASEPPAVAESGFMREMRAMAAGSAGAVRTDFSVDESVAAHRMQGFVDDARQVPAAQPVAIDWTAGVAQTAGPAAEMQTARLSTGRDDWLVGFVNQFGQGSELGVANLAIALVV
jgi:hypothetical protein